jgi:hypothetical protein
VISSGSHILLSWSDRLFATTTATAPDKESGKDERRHEKKIEPTAARYGKQKARSQDGSAA